MCPPLVATVIDNCLRNCPIARLDQSAPSRFARLLSVVQHLECDDYSKRAVEVLSRWNSLLGLSLVYSAANFLVPQILAHKNALVNGRIFIFTSTMSAMTSQNINSQRIFKCIFLFCLLVCALQVLKALFYANFHKLG